MDLTRAFRLWLLRKLEERRDEPEALGEALREAGLGEEDLATAREGSEEDLRRMMARFGLDPDHVPAAFVEALRDAERVCAHCLQVGRCHRYLAAEAPADDPHAFCPNAEFFDQMVAALRRSR